MKPITIIAPLAALATSVSLLTPSAFPQSHDGLPAVVQAEINRAQSSCEPERSALKPGFVVEKDINGDGVKDYILDYSQFECGGHLFFCGTAGCLTQVFASLSDGGYVKIFDENVRNIQFRTVKRRPAMILELHGSACGRSGAASCTATLFWNGEKFSPAN
jgi:hypothetical protein